MHISNRQRSRSSQLFSQPTALEEPDYESEPSTEDDEDDEVNGPLRPALPPTSTPSDIKPQACKPSTSSFSTAVAPAVPDQAKFSIDVGEDDVDTGDEPDTEPSDVEVNGPPSSLTPHFPAHTHTSSSSPIASAVKHVSQSQAYSSASQRLSQHSPASQMPMDVEGDTSEDDVFLRGYKAQADKKRREEEKQAAQRREAKQAQMAAERAQRREEELAQRVAEGRGEKEFDGGDDQDETDDDDVPMWESHAVRPEVRDLRSARRLSQDLRVCPTRIASNIRSPSARAGPSFRCRTPSRPRRVRTS